MVLRRGSYVFAFVLLASLAAGQAQNAPPITTDSSEQQIRQAVGTARMGKKLTPKLWPNGARVAVCLSFDVDNGFWIFWIAAKSQRHSSSPP
jgi:hypothetical protein